MCESAKLIYAPRAEGGKGGQEKQLDKHAHGVRKISSSVLNGSDGVCDACLCCGEREAVREKGRECSGG